MVQEIWKPIKDWPSYEVSNLGNVRSIERLEYFRGSLRIRKSCNLKQRVLRQYFCVGLKNYGKFTTAIIHRLVAEHFVPNPENKPFVNHKDKNKLNNRAENLEWVTQKENIHHAMQFDDWTRGINNGNAKLTDEDIRKIRSYDKSYLWLAKEYNVAYTTIKRIRTKTSWKHVN